MMRLSSTQAKRIYTMMQFIRKAEEAIADNYSSGQMRCPTHLSIGQECVPAVLSEILTNNDLAVSTHRAHAHYLAKGGSLDAMVAEIYGKATGCSGGRGGSMHLIDESVGFMGSTAIVGNTIPIGVGLALAKKIKSESGIAVVFLGDGAIEEGVFYESANFAALKKLPVLFVCENNLYSVYSSLKDRQPMGRKIHELAASIGLWAKHGNGNSVEEAYNICLEAYKHVLSGQGAAFIELDTYRWREHCGPNYDNDIGYRSVAEYEKYRANDPIAAFEAQLIENKIISQVDCSNVVDEINRKIAQAFESAKAAPFPDELSRYQHVYAQESV